VGTLARGPGSTTGAPGLARLQARVTGAKARVTRTRAHVKGARARKAAGTGWAVGPRPLRRGACAGGAAYRLRRLWLGYMGGPVSLRGPASAPVYSQARLLLGADDRCLLLGGLLPAVAAPRRSRGPRETHARVWAWRRRRAGSGASALIRVGKARPAQLAGRGAGGGAAVGYVTYCRGPPVLLCGAACCYVQRRSSSTLAGSGITGE
jgi:hypothetical protein